MTTDQLRIPYRRTTMPGLLALLIVGCQADLGASRGRAGSTGVDDDAGSSLVPGSAGPLSAGVTCEDSHAEATPLRRLTRTEYRNTVRDILGVELGEDANLPGDERKGPFAANTASAVSLLSVEQYAGVAAQVAEEATQDWEGLTSCEVLDRSCAKEFVRHVGRSLYRRALSESEADGLLSMFDLGAARLPQVGLSLVIQGLLSSPYFLYRLELPQVGPEDATGEELTEFELATRLAFLLTASGPDEELLDLAERGELLDEAAYEEQVSRLLESDRVSGAIESFVSQWLQLDDLLTAERDSEAFTDSLKQAMFDETRIFADQVFHEGSVSEMFSAGYTFVNPELAEHYGIPSPADGFPQDGFAQVDLPETRRGVLTHGSVLTASAGGNEPSPIFRGKFFRENILCQELPPPPAGLVTVPPSPSEDSTIRERYTALTQENASCAGCHDLINPPGYAFGVFDSSGHYQTTEGQHPIDSSGELIATRDTDGAFTDGASLSLLVAEGEELQDCFALQWSRFAYGTGGHIESLCSAAAELRAWKAEGAPLKGLLRALALSPAFRVKRAVE